MDYILEINGIMWRIWKKEYLLPLEASMPIVLITIHYNPSR